MVLRILSGFYQFRLRDYYPLRSLLSSSTFSYQYRSIIQSITPVNIAIIWFRLYRFRSPLLTVSRLISLPMGTEMFQFPTCPSINLWIQLIVPEHLPQVGSPIRKSTHQRLFAPPRGLSQLVTSFIGSWWHRHSPYALISLTFNICFSLYIVVNTFPKSCLRLVFL